MVIKTEPINLRLTLIDSAQCFLWREVDDGFASVVNEKAVFVKQTGEGLLCEGMDEAALIEYFDLDRDYSALKDRFQSDAIVSQCMRACDGLRVLRQPVWDATVMFILSANNNVSRITSLTRRLSERFGRCIDTDHGRLYGIPTPEALAKQSEDALRALGVGYRAPYLIKTARMAMEGFPFDALSRMPYDEAHATMTALPGVGAKVADCILLFGCGHAEAFPTDVWVERLLGDWFGMTAPNRKALSERARKRFGREAGIVQQFLFHAARSGVQINRDLTQMD